MDPSLLTGRAGAGSTCRKSSSLWAPLLASLNNLKDRASAEAGKARLSHLSSMRAEGSRGPWLCL